MRLPLRIAILECDTPLDRTRAEFGRYGGVFRQLLERAADRLGHAGLSATTGLELSFWPVQTDPGKYPPLEDVDAVMLTGSRYNAFDSDGWIISLTEYIKRVLVQDRVRVIGVCFGHQIVARALDMPVGRSDMGWEISVMPVELTELGKALFKQEKLSIYQMHRDIVFGFPEGVEPLGSSPRCTNQGMYSKGRFITVQGHPEFTRDIVEEILRVRHAAGVFPDDLFEDGVRRLQDHDDGVAVAEAFLRFLLGP